MGGCTASAGTVGVARGPWPFLGPAAPLLARGCTLAQHSSSPPHTPALAGASGVAIAAFNKLAPSLRNKHSVIIVCGGNMSREGMERVYEVAAGVDRTTSKQRPRQQPAAAS